MDLITFIFPEQLITPEQFAEILCDDLDLNQAHFLPAVSQAIRQQIDAFPLDNILEEQADQRVVVKVTGRQGHRHNNLKARSGLAMTEMNGRPIIKELKAMCLATVVGL